MSDGYYEVDSAGVEVTDGHGDGAYGYEAVDNQGNGYYEDGAYDSHGNAYHEAGGYDSSNHVEPSCPGWRSLLRPGLTSGAFLATRRHR